MADPVRPAPSAVEAAAAACATAQRPAALRPPWSGLRNPEFGDYSTNARCCSRRVGRAAARHGPRSWRKSWAAASKAASTGSRSPTGFLNLFLADCLVPACRRGAGGTGRPPSGGRHGPARPRSGSTSSSSPPTDRARHRRGRAWGGPALDRARPGVTDTPSCASTTSTIAADRSIGSRLDRRAMRGEPVPEDGYEGAYVAEVGQALKQEERDPDDLAPSGVAVSPDAGGCGGDPATATTSLFDVWSSEARAARVGRGREGLREAREAGHVYESEGATWRGTHGVRRRQGPRPDPVRWRVHLLPLGHRLPPARSSIAARTG